MSLLHHLQKCLWNCWWNSSKFSIAVTSVIIMYLVVFSTTNMHIYHKPAIWHLMQGARNVPCSQGASNVSCSQGANNVPWGQASNMPWSQGANNVPWSQQGARKPVRNHEDREPARGFALQCFSFFCRSSTAGVTRHEGHKLCSTTRLTKYNWLWLWHSVLWNVYFASQQTQWKWTNKIFLLMLKLTAL